MKTLFQATILVALACPSLAATVDLREMIDQGIALHDQGRHAEAIATVREGLRQDPKNESALYELAHSLFARNAFDEASRRRREACNCLDLTGSPEKAVKVYQRGLSDPTDPGLAFNCALTQLHPKAMGCRASHRRI